MTDNIERDEDDLTHTERALIEISVAQSSILEELKLINSALSLIIEGEPFSEITSAIQEQSQYLSQIHNLIEDRFPRP